MKTKAPRAIRISVTPEVNTALRRVKKRYPTLSEPEILKLSLAALSNDDQLKTTFEKESDDIMAMAAHAVGYDYLSDPEEDMYTEDMGVKVDFS